MKIILIRHGATAGNLEKNILEEQMNRCVLKGRNNLKYL